ncbi:alpha/beta hydrolase [Brevundimonas sp. LM2]|uniref:alpha/beta hydrolase n=1 Tax=Brevundimonas sp. LM2 TaxID=1938605 RepID=UPI000983F8D8|nr:alpha/beta hydrolase [Brevundimonas sp. LM2]AQR62060.1 alpha/beta hydrolase [Brevundimonas sp. LM2]
MRRVSFKSRTLDIAGALHLPPDFDETRTWPALVLTTPGSSVKEQIGAIYGERMAARGFVALAFDPSYQGESGGEPRHLEDPSSRIEDIHCAVDFLMTLSFIDEARVGLLGICAGGGYGIAAAVTEHRFRAIGTVVASNIGSAFRGMQPDGDVVGTLRAVGAQRTAEARGAPAKEDPWIPDSLAEAHAQGVTDPDLLEAVWFYRESLYRHPNSTNRLLFRSNGYLLGFDAFHLVPDLLTQPLQIIVAGRRSATGQYENGQTLFDRSPSRDKDFFVVEGAGHYDMYFKPEYVDQAIERLTPFFVTRLGA